MSLNHKLGWLRKTGLGLTGVIACVISFYPALALAADNDFNIQVSPSPLAVVLTPGKQQTAELTVRNFSNHTETVRPSLNGFTIDGQKITLSKDAPANMKAWVSFGQQQLSLQAGDSQKLSIIYNTPTNVGFSYAAAITLTRADSSLPTDISGAKIKGAVAVFNLINVNRPDAKSALAIQKLASDKNRYEFLPASFYLTVKNTGNVISQPTGTLFIQRSSSSNEPLASIPLNAAGGYVLPGTTRTFVSTWQDGFPAYEKTANGKSGLKWTWSHLSQLRFGRYVAKAVVVYNSGHGDMPVTTEYTFWVIPWRLIGLTVLVIAILVSGLYAWGRLAFKGVQKVQRRAHK